MNVTKRNGKTEKINLEKIHQVVEWAAEGLDVSVSQVELDAQIQFYEGIKTKDIHNTLIRAAADLISEETPDYQYLSARLAMFAIRKEAYGQYTPRKLAEQLEWGVAHNLYDKGLLESYTAEELETIEGFVDHERDMNYAYAGIEQLRSKYLVQDRVTKQVYESPQTALILISMTIFSEKYKGKQRLRLVHDLYNELSTFKVSLPTPIMAGVRTPSRQFSSCVLIECDDSLDSIKASSNAIVDYISRKAGIGLNVGRIRAEGSPIRNGEARHTGVIPFLKLFQASVKSCLTPRTFVLEETKGITPIKDIQIGDRILSYGEEGKKFQRVLDIWETLVPKERQVDVILSNGLIIEASKDHPFMVKTEHGLKRVLPDELSSSDCLVSAKGETLHVHLVSPGDHDETFYDITVEGLGVLFAGSDMMVEVA